MFCARCGAEIREDDRYCTSCGLAAGAQPPKVEARQLVRPQDDRKIAGVCAGVARYFAVDPTLVRVLWALSILLGGTGLLVYLICWIVMPNEQQPAPSGAEQGSGART